jgi:anti-sigma factor RsiW
MSSNPYHNNSIITRSNYEEYFLLYVDDELSAEDKAAVDQFLLLNPDLAQELDILQQAKLPEEFILMDEKESLFSDSMKTKAFDEALLLYVDNELNEAESRAVEEKLKQDAAYRLEYELLLKTKSPADEIVTCTFKGELYRHEKRRIPVLWWRVAAAVLVVLSIGTVILTSQQQDQPGTVAVHQPGQKPADKVSITSNQDTDKEQEAAKETTPSEILNDVAVKEASDPAGDTPEKSPVLAMQKIELSMDVKEENATVRSKPINDKADVKADVVSMPLRPDHNKVLMPKLVEAPLNKSLTNDPVTSDTRYAYNQIDASVSPVPADTDEEEKSKASLKGLLRKATRFVERRTNINVTNDDDELLIGAVAISLK